MSDIVVGILVGSESDRERMQPADDAIQIDTTDLEVDDVKALMIACCRGPQSADAHARRRMIAVISQGLRPHEKTVRRVSPARSR